MPAYLVLTARNPCLPVCTLCLKSGAFNKANGEYVGFGKIGRAVETLRVENAGGAAVERQQQEQQPSAYGGEGPELYSIFVGDMALKVTDQQLQDHFQQFFPSVNSAKVTT